MNNVNLHKEAVKAPLAPTFSQSTGCACGTTAGDNRFLDELKSHSTAVAGRNSPGAVVNLYLQASTQSYILDDSVPSQTGLWKAPSSFPPTTASLHARFLFSL